MAKIGYFTDPKLAESYTGTFIGVRLADIDLKDKYANMPIDDGYKNLLNDICSQRSGLVYTPYPKCCIMGSGDREWTYLIGIKPIYEFQQVNDKGNVRALYGGDNVIATARYNERPYFNSADDARMFIATRIAKFSTESVYDIAYRIGTYNVMDSRLMAMPEIKQEIKRELQNASADEPNGVRLKALIQGVIRYVDIKYCNNRERQAFELLVVGFTDEELRFYGFSDEEIVAGHSYTPSHD